MELLRGVTISALMKNDEEVESFMIRILGRATVHDVYHPNTGDLIIESGEEVNEEVQELLKTLLLMKLK